jgi:chaperonin cofactor prefoldin
MSEHITAEGFILTLEFLTKSSDCVEISTKVELIAYLKDARAFKRKFIFEPSKFDISQLAANLGDIDELKEFVNSQSGAYSADYLCSDPMVANQIAEKLKGPLSQILRERGLQFVQIERLSPVRLKPLPRSATTLSGMKPSAPGKILRTWHRPLLFTGIILLVVGFIFYWAQTSNTVSNLQSRISGSQVKVSSLQSELSSVNAQILDLQRENSGVNAQVASLNSQISSLNNQLSSLNSQISSLQTQNTDLQSIINLNKSEIIANQKTINQEANRSSLIVSFVAKYAGYIIVSGTSTTSTGYIDVTDSFNSYPYNDNHYTFGTGATRLIPILPGTVSVYFASPSTITGATATLTVTYVY